MTSANGRTGILVYRGDAVNSIVPASFLDEIFAGLPIEIFWLDDGIEESELAKTVLVQMETRLTYLHELTSAGEIPGFNRLIKRASLSSCTRVVLVNYAQLHSMKRLFIPTASRSLVVGIAGGREVSTDEAFHFYTSATRDIRWLLCDLTLMSEVGGLDERYVRGMFFQDMVFRGLAQGYQVNTVLVSKKSDAYTLTGTMSDYFLARNYLLFSALHSGFDHFGWRTICHICRMLLSGLRIMVNTHTADFLWSGLKDGWNLLRSPVEHEDGEVGDVD